MTREEIIAHYEGRAQRLINEYTDILGPYLLQYPLNTPERKAYTDRIKASKNRRLEELCRERDEKLRNLGSKGYEKLFNEKVNPYTKALNLFGLSQEFTLGSLNAARRSCSKSLHPDVCGRDTHEEMVAINNAYDLLKEKAL